MQLLPDQLDDFVNLTLDNFKKRRWVETPIAFPTTSQFGKVARCLEVGERNSFSPFGESIVTANAGVVKRPVLPVRVSRTGKTTGTTGKTARISTSETTTMGRRRLLNPERHSTRGSW